MKLSRKLNFPRCLCGRYESKAGCSKDRRIVRVLRSRRGKEKVWMVDHVESFSSEFELKLFPYRNNLLDREVKILVIGALQAVHSNVAE